MNVRKDYYIRDEDGWTGGISIKEIEGYVIFFNADVLRDTEDISISISSRNSLDSSRDAYAKLNLGI